MGERSETHRLLRSYLMGFASLHPSYMGGYLLDYNEYFNAIPAPQSGLASLKPFST